MCVCVCVFLKEGRALALSFSLSLSLSLSLSFSSPPPSPHPHPHLLSKTFPPSLAVSLCKRGHHPSICVWQGLSDVTMVVEDYTPNGAGELSVKQGQQIEVVDTAPPVGPTQAPGEWVLVRTMPPDGADPAQGLVPLSVLKPIAILRAGTRNSMELDGEWGLEFTLLNS